MQSMLVLSVQPASVRSSPTVGRIDPGSLPWLLPAVVKLGCLLSVASAPSLIYIADFAIDLNRNRCLSSLSDCTCSPIQ
ncbi:uncharacterized protein BDV14DRAFT_164185 [Aspergillus stella-maris]|uniref:uncharacterized protein n=1 Tax=Aspergillus stella-maris TaxID=1810926 RepID=UPI003CCE0B30